MLRVEEAPNSSYDLVHLGDVGRTYLANGRPRCFRPDSRDKVTKTLVVEFPRARVASWWPDHEDSPCLDDGGFVRQADKLLEGLRNARQPQGQDDERDRPVFFLCWGVGGGIVLKQALLKLIEHVDIDRYLYDSVSGIMFVGCAHDERSGEFDERVFWTLALSYDPNVHKHPVRKLRSRWRPVIEWAGSVTAKFRKLKLSIPVWTYYESTTTQYRTETSIFRTQGLSQMIVGVIPVFID